MKRRAFIYNQVLAAAKGDVGGGTRYLFMDYGRSTPTLRHVQALLRFVGRGPRVDALLLGGVMFLGVVRPVFGPHGVKHMRK